MLMAPVLVRPSFRLAVPTMFLKKSEQLLVQRPGITEGQVGADVIDRKSTRLNSSHSQISYAVFCLKKKNITYTGRPHAESGTGTGPSASASACGAARSSTQRRPQAHSFAGARRAPHRWRRWCQMHD